MQALVLNNGLSYRQDIPTPQPAKDEALIRLSLAGVCATDLELVKGYAGFSGILGHEFVGIVDAVSDENHQHWLKQRVVGSINIGCNKCSACKANNLEHCQSRTVLGIRGKNGVFADYFTLPVSNLHAVPDEVADTAAVFTEPLAAAVRVVKQLEPLGFSSVAVIGPGRLGVLIARVLALAGFDILVLGRSEQSLLLPRQWLLNTALIQDVDDNSQVCVVEASGHVGGFNQALRILRPRGTLILKSTYSSHEPVDLSKVVVAELNILGSRCGPFAEALLLLKQNVIAVENLIDGCYPLYAGLEAIQNSAEPGIRKVLLRP